MIDFQNDLRRVASAILTDKAVPFENLKPLFFTDLHSLVHSKNPRSLRMDNPSSTVRNTS